MSHILPELATTTAVCWLLPQAPTGTVPFLGVFRQMVLTVGLDLKNGTAAGARKSFKAAVEVTFAVALPGARGESPRLQRGVIPFSPSCAAAAVDL